MATYSVRANAAHPIQGSGIFGGEVLHLPALFSVFIALIRAYQAPD